MLSARTFLVGSSGESWSRFHSPKNMELWDLLSKSQNTNSSCHSLKHVLYGNVKKLSSFPFQYWFSTLSTDQTPYESHMPFTLGKKGFPRISSLLILRSRIGEPTKEYCPALCHQVTTTSLVGNRSSSCSWTIMLPLMSGFPVRIWEGILHPGWQWQYARWHLPNVNLNGAMWC